MAAERRPAAVAALGRRGRVLWRALGQKVGTVAGELALEACRCADRCEELNEVIAGRGVLELAQFRLELDFADDVLEAREVNIEVKFGAVLAEARQQQGRLAALLTQLQAMAEPAAAPPTPKKAESFADELRQRREDRGR